MAHRNARLTLHGRRELVRRVCELGLSISRVLCELACRYEYAHPGDLLHLDTKKLGEIVRAAASASAGRGGKRRQRGIGSQVVFVAVDDQPLPACPRLRRGTP